MAEPSHRETEPIFRAAKNSSSATNQLTAYTLRPQPESIEDLDSKDPGKRREFRWSQRMRDLVRANLQANGKQLAALITAIQQESGFPRGACWRFARKMGIRSKRQQRPWTPPEEQRLIKLLDLHPINEIARLTRRSRSSIFHKLYRLGANAKMGQDSFTKYTLATALKVNVSLIEEWVSRGWLKSHQLVCGKTERVIIEAEDFCDFCRKHTKDVVGNRLHRERLDFVYRFAFPPSHAELLPVRESKRERGAYEEQETGTIKKSLQSFSGNEEDRHGETAEESA